MTDRMDAHKQAFREEAYDLISELEDALMLLEEDLEDTETISRIFRALHTIKGSGAMFGFDDIAAFTHGLENVYDKIRNNEIRATKEIISLTLESKDYIHTMLDASVSGDAHDEKKGIAILETLDGLMPVEEAVVPVEQEKAGSPLEGQLTDIATYRLKFSPKTDLFRLGAKPSHLIEELGGMGQCYVSANISKVPALEDLNPEDCLTSWNIILTTDRSAQDIRNVFMFVEDLCDVRVDMLDEPIMSADEADFRRLAEIFIERGSLTSGEIEDITGHAAAAGKKDLEAQAGGAGLSKTLKVETGGTIRVASEKLDKLINLVGEMVTVQARLSQTAMERRDVELTSIAEEVERLTSGLHDSAMSARMVPIGSTFTRFKRLVRDLCSELGRDVALVTSGSETELDKTVIERLSDPMTHLIRNAIDHGIETPSVREAVGKERQGTLRLAASHEGSDVLIRIIDDGSGLDEEAIREKAVERGFIQPDAQVSRHDLLNMIFLPGFSTARKVSDVSGRGVGLDVVKRNVESLRGQVEIDSTRGTGTTISLRIPLTLAIIEGLLVKLGEDFFVMPLSTIDECVELVAAETNESHGRSLVNVRGELVPYIRLRQRFDINGQRPEREQVVIVNANNFKVGFAVDTVLGEHQTVIKRLSRVYQKVRGVSGATILGNGTVALILDMPRLIEDSELEERRRVS